MLSEITCPKCTKTLNTSLFNINTGFGRCDRCEALFSSEDIGLGQSPQIHNLPPKAIPHQVDTVEQSSSHGETTIVRKGSNPALKAFMTFFSIFWNAVSWGVMGSMYWDFFANGGSFHFAMMMPHPLIGIAIAYYTLTLWINKTTFHIDQEKLTVKTGPLKWFGDSVTLRSQIESIFIKEDVAMTKNGHPVYSLNLFAKLKSGDEVKILRNSSNKKELYFIESILERSLGLRDDAREDQYLRPSGS